MRAILLKQPGQADNLYIGHYEDPVVGRAELGVRVRATALNRADLLQRRGKYAPPEGVTPILGLEMAGEVERVGEGVTGWKEGDRVMALLPGGGYAEYVAIPSAMAMRIPNGFSYEEAAAIPEVFLTAYQALFMLGDLQDRENVLIHAGASGVGTAAIQLASVKNALLIVTAGSDEKLEACKRLGATHALNYKKGPFAAMVHTITEGSGADLILDFIGANYWQQNLAALSIDGRIVTLGLMGGGVIKDFDLAALFRKRGRLITSVLRPRPLSYKIELTRLFSQNALPMFVNGALKPVIDTVLPWNEASKAHERMESNLNIGKIVLRVD